MLSASEMPEASASPGMPAEEVLEPAGRRSPRPGTRVAVVVYSHYPSDPRPRRAAEALAGLGISVDVISLQQEGGGPRREVCNGVNVLRVPLKHTRGGKFTYIYQYSAFLLAGALVLALRSLRRRYDLVHVHNMPDVLVFSALVPKLLGAKVILDLHDPMPELMMSIFGLSGTSMAVRLLHGFERLSTRFADCVLTPNVAFENLFASRTCPKEKIRVIMNSPDEKIFALRKPEPAQSPRADRPFVMMFHGALVERHGLDLAVSALESVLRQVPGAQLRVYGKRTPFLEKVLKGLPARGPGGLEKAVLYCGPKSLEQIAAAISGCDLGLIPNRKSAFTALNMPTRIFEYLACGKPVIAPRTRGIQDYLSAGEVVFFDPDKPEDLAEQILRVYSNPGEVEAMVLRGQQVYLEHRWSKERERFCNLALDLLGVPSPSTL